MSFERQKHNMRRNLRRRSQSGQDFIGNRAIFHQRRSPLAELSALAEAAAESG
jgi:hypothetical protein